MDPLTVLNAIQIASPCPASWADMDGDDRARFCGSCRKHVYNIAEMTAHEALGLIERNEGHLCLKLYRRRDGTVLTADCPIGVRSKFLRRMRRAVVGTVVSLSVLLTGAVVRIRSANGSGSSWNVEPPPMGPGVTLGDWKEWALETIGWAPRSSRGMVAGGIRAIPIPLTAGSPAGNTTTCPVPNPPPALDGGSIGNGEAP